MSQGTVNGASATQSTGIKGVATSPFYPSPPQVAGGQTEEGLKTFGGTTPLGRPGQPVELASVYVELAASTSSYTTGQIYGQTGGRGLAVIVLG